MWVKSVSGIILLKNVGGIELVQVTLPYALLLFIQRVEAGDTDYTEVADNKFGSLSLHAFNLLRGNLALLITKTAPFLPDEIDLSDPDIVDVLREALFFEEFDRLAQELPIEILIELFSSMVRTFALDVTARYPIEDFCERIITRKGISVLQRKTCTNLLAIPIYFLTGKLDCLKRSVTKTTPEGLYLFAVCAQQQGEIDTAIELYEAGIRLAKKRVDDSLPIYAVFSYLYALALYRSEKPDALRKITRLFKRKELMRDWNYVPAYLLFAFKLGIPLKEIDYQLNLYSDKIYLFPTLHVLTGCVLRYHGVARKKNRINAPLLKKLESSDADWLKLEAFFAVPQKSAVYELLKARLGFPAFIAGRTKELDSKTETNLLINDNVATAESINLSEKKYSRIAYFVNFDIGYIQPTLQTSYNGVRWSFSRKIALARLANGTQTEMTEADRRLATAIEVSKMRNSSRREERLPFEAAIAQLVNHPYVFLHSNPDMPVVIMASPLELTAIQTDDGYCLSFNTTNYTSSIQIVKVTNSCYRVLRLNALQKRILEIVGNVSFFPKETGNRLMDMLSALSTSMIVHAELMDVDKKALANITADSRVVVQLTPVENSYRAELFIKPFTTHLPYCTAGIGSKIVQAIIDGDRNYTQRNFTTELANQQTLEDKLREILKKEEEAPQFYLIETREQMLKLLEVLQNQTTIALAEWTEKAAYTLYTGGNFSNLFLSLKTKNNWFEIEGSIKLNDEINFSVQTIVANIREGNLVSNFVELVPGEYLLLTEKLRERLVDLERIITVDKSGELLLPRFATSIVDELLEAGVHVQGDVSFKQLQQNIIALKDKKYPVPLELKAKLREYQIDGFRWMARLADMGAGGCLADDMGLGKTLQTIAMLLHKATEGPSLVICPVSILRNWQQELRAFAPSLRVLTLNSTDNRLLLVDEANANDVLLVTYGLLVNECTILTAKKWNVMVLDEAHTIKNRGTGASKAAMQLQGRFRLLLTGTPIQNYLGELWNLFAFITPGLLDTFENFTTRFINPIVFEQDKNIQTRLKQLISPFLLRRTKESVLDELPPKMEIIQRVELFPNEKKYYEVLRQRMEQAFAEQQGTEDRLQVFAAVTRLRMAACNLHMLDDSLSAESSKLEAFMAIVDDLIKNGHRALVFSQFTTHLDLIRKKLEECNIKYLYLDGSVPAAIRGELVTAFQTGTTPLFLISLRAGGVGLNLTAADFVIHMDPWWNPAVEDQASDRAHRIGQLRPVTVYRLIAQGTIEEKIIRLHATKRDLADSLLEGSDLSAQLTCADLLNLLKE